jgi:CheY-like chemotaxis protein
MVGDEVKCREARCDGYLTKPIDRSTLLKAIAQHAAGPLSKI